MDKEVWSLIFKAINFLIIIVILYKLLAGRVKTFFENRSLAIKKEIQEADMSKKEAERRYEELKNRLENIDEEIKELTAVFEKEGMAEKEKIIESAKKEADKIKDQAVRTIEQEVVKARLMLRKEYADLIIEMSEHLIKKRLTGKDQQQIFKEYIEKVGQLN